MTRIAKVAEMIKIRSVLLRVAVVVGYSGSVVLDFENSNFVLNIIQSNFKRGTTNECFS